MWLSAGIDSSQLVLDVDAVDVVLGDVFRDGFSQFSLKECLLNR